jgi:hypothetical protein
MDRDLIDSLIKVVNAFNEENDELNRYEGYEWGYHGWRYTSAREDAMKGFEKELNAYIEARIRRTMKDVYGITENNLKEEEEDW